MPAAANAERRGSFDSKGRMPHEPLTPPTSAGNLVKVRPGFQPGGSLNVFSVTVDFVF
jgi:hypothetical protein